MEDAFFQYALLRTAARYPDLFKLSQLPLHSSTLMALSKFTPLYHDAFMAKYASKMLGRMGAYLGIL